MINLPICQKRWEIDFALVQSRVVDLLADPVARQVAVEEQPPGEELVVVVGLEEVDLIFPLVAEQELGRSIDRKLRSDFVACSPI